MDEHEKYVRERWQYVSEEKCAVVIHELPSYGHGFRFTGLKDRWVRARAFTVERERQIAEQIVDVERVKRCAAIYGAESCRDNVEAKASWNRILSREQERLAALKQGLKQ